MEEFEKKLREESRLLLGENTDIMRPGDRYQWIKRAERVVVKIRLLEFLGKRTENKKEFNNLSIDDFGFSVRARNALVKANIRSIGELMDKTDKELLCMRNFGLCNLKELRMVIALLTAQAASGTINK